MRSGVSILVNRRDVAGKGPGMNAINIFFIGEPREKFGQRQGSSKQGGRQIVD